MPAAPVTVVITRAVRPGSEEAFEREVRDWIPTALQFDGHQGAFILRPPAGRQEYGAVIRFHSQAAWEAFRDSDEYRAFLTRIREHLQEDPRVELANGLEGWFAAPGARLVEAPPRWKMALVTWIGVCIAILALNLLIGPLMERWPSGVRFAVFNAAVVAALTWVLMPLLTRLLRRLGFLAGRPSGGIQTNGR